MSALAEVTAAVDASLRGFALPELPPDRFGGDHAFTLEAVYEGFLLHYGEPRAFAGMDEGLRLLSGDALYALGLERLAQAGDVQAVAELGDLISLCSRAAIEERGDLVEALWEATARRLAGMGEGARAEVPFSA